MPYDESVHIPAGSHCLKLDSREMLNISGVEDVSGFDEGLVILTTALGELNIRGSGLHIEKIDLSSGLLELRGNIQELSYDESNQSSSLWKKLFG